MSVEGEEAIAVSRGTLEALYDAFGRGDMEAVAATYADDIEWRVNGPSPVTGRTRSSSSSRG